MKKNVIDLLISSLKTFKNCIRSHSCLLNLPEVFVLPPLADLCDTLGLKEQPTTLPDSLGSKSLEKIRLVRTTMFKNTFGENERVTKRRDL